MERDNFCGVGRGEDRRMILIGGFLGAGKTTLIETVFAPDEAYFATVLAASGKAPLQGVANRPITWTEWKEGEGHPQEFDRVPPRIAAQIAESGCFFARKFVQGSDIARWGLHHG